MGKVVMETEFLGNSPIDNYPELKLTEYIYCDKCGSFNIVDYTPPETWRRISIGLLIAGIASAILLAIFKLGGNAG